VAQLACRLKHLIISLSRSRKAIEGVGPNTKFFVDPLDANGWKEGVKGDARTLAAAPLLPEERALIAPLLVGTNKPRQSRLSAVTIAGNVDLGEARAREISAGGRPLPGSRRTAAERQCVV
jgi:hypothetical protein